MSGTLPRNTFFLLTLEIPGGPVPGPLKIYHLWDEILSTFRPNQSLGGIQAWYVNAKDAHKILRTEKLAVVPEIQPFL